VLNIDDAVQQARSWYPGKLVHVECDTVDKLQDALDAGADAVLLDNMSPDEARHCVELVDEHAALAKRTRPLVELSGGITIETVRSYGEIGADLVSSGAITNSASVLDIGLDIDVDPHH
jgi:nicotinate-nucleotide pyrophosphorylase (carboxylating)